MADTGRLAVTGMAWTTPLGNELDGVWKRLCAAESGFAPCPGPASLRNRLAAAVPGVALDLPPAQRMLAIAIDAARRALQSAPGPVDSETRLVVGTSLGSYLEDEPPAATTHAWADELARELGLTKPPLVVCTACSSGADAIRLAAELLRSGAEQRCLCGGADILTDGKRLSHSALGTMSPTLLRAFDIRRDGTLLGDGAAFLLLEREGGPRRPLAFYRGGGGASDAQSMTAPDATGAAVKLAIERSLTDAGLTLADVATVNAHGSATPLNDQTEREALRSTFGTAERPVVFATKGNFGHSLGATGAIEAVALILALRAGEVPPIVNLEQPDPGFPLPLPMGKSLRLAGRIGISVTLGFGGFDTSVVFEAAV